MRKGRSDSDPSGFSLVLLIISVLSIINSTTMVASQNTTTTNIPVKVGVILNMDKWVGKMGLSCINMALSDFYAAHPSYKTRIVLHPRDANSDVVTAAAAALDLINNVEVQAILGPATSMQANFVIQLGEKAQVPVISFSASSPSLSSRNPYFMRATQVDTSQLNAIAALVKAFGWREAVPIYADDEYGREVIPYLDDALQVVNVRVLYKSIISASASDDQIGEELFKLMTMQTRVFIVHMLPSLASRLFFKAKEIGMLSEGYVWIVTDGITAVLSSFDSEVIDAMHGVLGVKTYIPKSKALGEFQDRWKRKFRQDNPDVLDPELNIYGLYAYDVTIALAMAIEKAGTANLVFKEIDNPSSILNTDLETSGVSLYGPDLLRAFSDTKLKGITGEFVFINRQLQSSSYQIVNVNGNAARGIGFWTPRTSLIQQLNSTMNNINSYSTSRSRLASVIWPGDSTDIPKGWQIPTNGKRLRIGVPIKEGYVEFVKVTKDPSTNITTFHGYSFDVFDAVVTQLPYALGYEYISFAKPDGKTAGTYDDLVYQVYLGNYDAVVGDVTITANRSQYVDFTLPYTESGVSMIVPVKDSRGKNAWAFLKPLTWDLWATSFCFFVFMGFVVWVLEHRVNEDFRGPPSHQVGTSFWFSFSTMVFSQREKLVSNLARVVIMIWCFVVLILTQSYTASLTSLLTVEQLQPTITNVNDLIKNGAYVGYKDGSFVEGILKKLGFEERKLLVYRSPEECDELFRKGSGNGGIAAAFDEVPYIKLFLSQYCSKYTMIDPTFKTAGFGYVFPKDSPLVPDISKAILKVIEEDKMKKIEQKWFGKHADCPDSSTSVTTHSLGLDSFWGLFLITGLISLLALLIFSINFLNENVHVLLSSNSEASVWCRVCNLFTIYNQKDYKSHTFKTRGMDIDRTSICLSSPAALSPFSCSIHTEFSREQRSPSAKSDACLNSKEHQDALTISCEPTTRDPDSETPIEIVTTETHL